MIDAHLHVWDHRRSGYGWLDQAPELLRRDHLPSEALDMLAKHGFARAVLVQADETLTETEYLLELVATEPRFAGAVVYLPLEAPDTVAEHLTSPAAGVVGVRNLTHDRPDPDWILGAEQRRSIDLIGAAGLPLDVVATLPRHRENLLTLARQHPSQTFVLDHLGTPALDGGDAADLWREQLGEIASCPNTVAKVSGIYASGGPASADQMRAVLGTAVELFGPDRLMVGTDWPVCTAFGGAEATLAVLLSAVGELEPDQQTALRTGTAARVYGVPT
ncbi:amidohydrolase family protein [Ruania alba]|uniref:L-fuconolactonase n=1 Tax=Ruania alba TaxID=648782 RepID=A0A1H5L3M1_9MICO|nr:amidohydrolase family protein [Ruania alba]SEE71540.1 L-fuconolactonase [Ruania alba]